MKKRWLTFIMTALVIGMLSGCGQTEKRETETKLKETKIEEATEDKSEDVTDFSLRDINVDDYVTLGEYKGLVIELEGPEVTDEELDEYAYEMYDWFLSPENGGIMDRAVENGDVVNVDYEGTVNGETFEGGTGESMSLYIGSGQYVDGIEEGLIGVMPGETVTLQLLFPEEFVESPAAGEEVEFTVTVNFIVPETMEDEVIAAFGLDGVETVDDFRNMFHDTVLFNKMEDFDQEEAAADKIIEVLADNCTYVEKEEFPQEMIELYEEDLRSYIEEVAKEYDMEAEEVAETLYGTGYGYNSLPICGRMYGEKFDNAGDCESRGT